MVRTLMEIYEKVSSHADLTVKGDWMVYLAVDTVIRKAELESLPVRVILLKPDGQPISEHEIFLKDNELY